MVGATGYGVDWRSPSGRGTDGGESPAARQPRPGHPPFRSRDRGVCDRPGCCGRAPVDPVTSSISGMASCRTLRSTTSRKWSKPSLVGMTTWPLSRSSITQRMRSTMTEPAAVPETLEGWFVLHDLRLSTEAWTRDSAFTTKPERLTKPMSLARFERVADSDAGHSAPTASSGTRPTCSCFISGPTSPLAARPRAGLRSNGARLVHPRAYSFSR